MKKKAATLAKSVDKAERDVSTQALWKIYLFSRWRWGVALILCSSLLTIALYSYSASDLTANNADKTCSNVFGAFGATIAYYLFISFGVAAYSIVILLAYIGIILLTKARFKLKLGAALVWLISVSCLLCLQYWFGKNWLLTHKMTLLGGKVGQLSSDYLVQSINRATAILLVVLLIYIATCYLLHRRCLPWSIKKIYAVYLASYHLLKKLWLRWRKFNAIKAQKLGLANKNKAIKEESKVLKSTTTNSNNKLAENTANNTAVTTSAKIIDGANKKHQTCAEIERQQHSAKPLHGNFTNYQLPALSLLGELNKEEADNTAQHSLNEQELLQTQQIIIHTLQEFKVEVTAGDITRGPSITRYEFYPKSGLRVSKITQLEANIALATCAEQINILAPIPGKNTVGIEIANNQKTPVVFRELLEDASFWQKNKRIPLALGKDVYGNTVVGDLAAMPHLLVAGATGSGKSVCINTIITSILYRFTPDQLRFIMVDPKVVEMQVYSDLPHLITPVVTEPHKVLGALKWVINEMEKRYRMFAECKVRNFEGFNQRELSKEEQVEEVATSEAPERRSISLQEAIDEGVVSAPLQVEEKMDIPDTIPYIVVIVDELADLMQTASAEVELLIARITQKARAAGIHLILATQTPRADVVTGIIKANIPCRIAFQVSSALDSRVILDSKGAEKLLGKGDMLYLAPGTSKLERSQGAFISDQTVIDIVAACSQDCEQQFEQGIQQAIEYSGSNDAMGIENSSLDGDELLVNKAIELIQNEQKISTSLLQRRFKIGYGKAARIIDMLEERGVIGPQLAGAKQREIYLKD